MYCWRLLRDAGYEVECFYGTEARRTWQQLRRVYQEIGHEAVQHRAYLDVNRRGALERRWRVPYLSQFQVGEMIALALPYALARRCGYVALGLERSSDVPGLMYRGRPVNHQHQKSSSFISALNRYLAVRFSGAVRVVSPIHGLYDLGVYARLLRTAPSLVRLQSSCGGSNGQRAHCGRCEKCAFLAGLLAGLSGNRGLYRRLFPNDPLSVPALYGEWLSWTPSRPLTCAGLKDELRLALCLAKARGWRSAMTDPWCYAPSARAAHRRLAYLLAAHESGLIPSSMARRLAPPMSVDFGELHELLDTYLATSTPSSS